MIEYANEFIIKLLKQYDMLSKSLKLMTDMRQKNDICEQMTRIIQNVLEETNAIYEEKYHKVEKRSVYLMDEEKNRLLELINLIAERRAYVNNQIISNKELTGMGLDTGPVLGEENLEEYKVQVKIIDKYKNNIRMEGQLQDELRNIEANIKKTNNKISNNQNLNKQLEDKMIRIVDNALTKLSLYDLQKNEKDIDLAYTELGYSLEKAKENANVARRDYNEDIVAECENMLSTISAEYTACKEKKLILQLISKYKEPVTNYDELVNKREIINSILLNIPDSELYSVIGPELNKQYATIKLEGQDIEDLKNLTEEKNIKEQTLEAITYENNSEQFKTLLSGLLENERKHQEQLKQEARRKEQERLERKRQEEKRKLEEMAKRQKAIEEERKKEIERRTKQLLEEKQKTVLLSKKSTSKDETDNKETGDSTKSSPRPKQTSPAFKEATRPPKPMTRPPKPTTKPTTSRELRTPNFGPMGPTREPSRAPRPETRDARINKSREREKTTREIIHTNEEIFSKPTRPARQTSQDDFFSRELKNNKIVDQGIPVIRNNKLDSEVVTAKSSAEPSLQKVFPDIPLEKKETIFPDLPDLNQSNSFFDENEFNDLSNYMEDDNKKSWF